MKPAVLALLAALLLRTPARAGEIDHRGAQLIAWEIFGSFRVETGEEAGTQVLVSPVVRGAFPWKELVVSWNSIPEVALSVEVRVVRPEGMSRYYLMGRWSTDPALGPRASLNGQKDADGEVRTDVLVVSRPAREFQLRVTLRGGQAAAAGLEFLSVMLNDPDLEPLPLPPNQKAWGHVLRVPARSQADYPEGVQNWCSPTSTTMILAYWARTLKRPQLDWQVPDVARAVHDPEWPGTGNWPFNTAFAGMQPGLRACVARFTDLAELEDWIAQGLPVAASVSYAQLKGNPDPEPGDGHLVVVAGFTRNGDVVINDPGVRRDRVRRTIPRSHFAAAWTRSHRTVYLIWPDGRKRPANSRGHW